MSTFHKLVGYVVLIFISKPLSNVYTTLSSLSRPSSDINTTSMGRLRERDYIKLLPCYNTSMYVLQINLFAVNYKILNKMKIFLVTFLGVMLEMTSLHLKTSLHAFCHTFGVQSTPEVGPISYETLCVYVTDAKCVFLEV
ncbi:hypothetical protein E2986_12332 [Frieseomelitta varia]|uniref:Uncharacterized protein n=1 Tax=Frieseomelitta varia TaxID=561572 RepID=A0A833W7D7_9HYME|nr:hypothetical protein E2986_12332 [Frieseomelitta varia]